MDSLALRLLAEAIALAPDELERRLMLNVLMGELERLRRASEAGGILRAVRGENGT